MNNVKKYESKNRKKRKKRRSSSDEDEGKRYRIHKDRLYPERDLISDESLNYSLSMEDGNSARRKYRKYDE